MQEAEMVCPECGTKIEAWESRCRNCGHKRDKKSGPIGFKIATFLLALLVLALFGMYWYEHTGYKKQVSSLRNEVQHLTDENGDLKKSLDYQYERVSELTDEVVRLQELTDYKRMQFYKDEYQFFCDLVCIWQDDGTNYCHMYGCELVDKSKWDFIIINQAGAKIRIDNGEWNACPLCVPNLVRGSLHYARWQREQIKKNNGYPST